MDAGDLAAVRDGLLAAGVDGATPVAVTGDGTGETQYTTASTVDSFVAAALGFTGRVVLSLGAGAGPAGEARLVGEPPAVRLEGARAADQGAGRRDERAAARPTARSRARCRRSRSSRRARRPRWSGRSRAWSTAGTPGPIFTSVNAVRAVWEKFAEHGLDARHFGGVKIACIGEATADAVRAFGIQPELIPAGEQTSEGLLAEFSPHDEILDPVGRVLLPRADIATETLAAGLTERGWEVDDVTAYRTVRAAPPPAEIRDAIKSGGFDAVLFTSSSTVRNLVGIAGKPHARTVVAVIGPEDRRHRRRVRAAGRRPAAALVGARPGRGARRVRGGAAREARGDAGQAAPRLQGAGPDRAAVPLIAVDESWGGGLMSYPDVRPRRLRRTRHAPAGGRDPAGAGRADPAACSSRRG